MPPSRLLLSAGRRALLQQRPVAIRTSAPPSCWTAAQRRWAAVHDVRFLRTDASAVATGVAEKYRAKLAAKARAEGLGDDVDALRDAYADKIAAQRKRGSAVLEGVPGGLDALLEDQQPPPAPTTTTTTTTQQQGEEVRNKAKGTGSGTGSGIKPLSAILDLDKARALPEKELSAVWRLRHAASPASLAAVIPAATWAPLEAAARAHRTFVLPVPRAGAGAEMHLLQWVFDAATRTATVLFTQLAEYKARGEWALPHTSATHYADPDGLSSPARQGLVLMAGAVVEGRGASVEDARFLLMLMQRFYGAGAGDRDRAKRELLEQFGRGDGGFSVDRLLEECEKLG
ncbi:ATP11-domain-containing protein [Xylariomycetidae sp. FL0641]|nr:ATP11-domain-containing protein [Xylariomycetidae sp. FL0641]